ncbi:MAG: Na(+)-translocating NADH-quinone reductase subunit A [Deltaproteobacteria bacterium]|nr:Na(+)-translocating NADH-quinone reductase subunit A [Deltaproteobacteria bacterium]
MGKGSPVLHRVKRGLALPITGVPLSSDINEAEKSEYTALIAEDYPDMRPSFKVKEGDLVKRGDILFEDRKNPGVLFTSTACGKVSSINKGEKRAFISAVISITEDDNNAEKNELSYKSYAGKEISNLTSTDIRELLIESGLWTAFRSRPYEKIPAVDAKPDALFVTVIDSNPLAPEPTVLVNEYKEQFEAGLKVLSIFKEDAKFFYCKDNKSDHHVSDFADAEIHEFEGRHPAGTAGFHIHSLYPVNRARVAWHIGYQDVIAVGALFLTGKQMISRVVTVAGSAAEKPAYVKTRLGADISSITADRATGEEVRVISGSVFNGRDTDTESTGFLGRYHNQVTLLKDDSSRRFLGWLAPGSNIFSVTNLFLSSLFPSKKFNFTTDRFGGHRTPVPFTSYQKVFAFELLSVPILRALLSGDLETAESLGVLELAEEDVSLLTFVCPSKNEYGPLLRNVLNRLEKEA